MLDVRANIEYIEGSMASSINVPLLNDNERHLIGICYKEKGQEAAIALGHQLVTGDVKEERLRDWSAFVRDHPNDGYLYCFRGGLRSQTVQDWLEVETGIRYPLVEGGYKAMRRFLLDELEVSLDTQRTELVMLTGKTGSGKTRVIHQVPAATTAAAGSTGGMGSIDLEGMANHRGSSFGASAEQRQPSQIDFENAVSTSLLKLLAHVPKTSPTRVLVEDESRRIGQLVLPPTLWTRMQDSPQVIMVEEGLQERITVILEDYVLELGQQYVTLYGTELGPELHQTRLCQDLNRIRKLGGDRRKELSETMKTAFAEQSSTGDTSLHRIWIARLLEDYYDPMYDYQMTLRGSETSTLFRGSRQDVIEFANQGESNTFLH